MKTKAEAFARITPPDFLLRDFLGTEKAVGISDNGMPDSVLVAYSGGADSSLALHLMNDWSNENGVKIYAAHINHGIRGDEALRDREHCRTECEKLGVRLFILDADVPSIAAETGKSIEEAARDVRYGFFEKIMRENNIPVLFTAHNADDNLETIIFRLARGSAARGLCGIPAVRRLGGGGFVVRPMLAMTKNEILDFCDEYGIEYVYDSTNSDTVYVRNNIRARVLPAMREINPDVATSVLRLASLLSEDCTYLDRIAQEFAGREDATAVSELKKLEKPILYRVLAVLFGQYSSAMLEYVHLEALSDFLDKGKEHSSLSLPGRTKATIEGGRLLFAKEVRKKPEKKDFSSPIELSLGENLFFDEYLLLIEEQSSTKPSQSTPQIQDSEGNVYKLFTHITISSDKINESLFARGRIASDKIRRGGMSKDVRKLFSERAVPLDRRASYPIVLDGEGILWIPDIAVRDGVKDKKMTDNENGSKALRFSLYVRA